MSMEQQADDLREEGDALNAMLKTLAPEEWARATPFKNWTVNDVMQHLHQGDWMKVLTMKDSDAYVAAAASRPSLIAQTTSEAPRTISPPANTPSRLVIIEAQSTFTVPQRVTSSSGASNITGRSSGSKPSALIARSAFSVWLEPAIG